MNYVKLNRNVLYLRKNKVLDNADKYSPHGMPIEVTARIVDGWVEIDVSDQGSGIPLIEQTRVFERFYRVQQADGIGGTGLGLSICKGILDIHGGQIEANSAPGEGTTMTVRLPLNRNISEADAAETSTAETSTAETSTDTV